MRIVHVSTHDIKGGAARATFRLHQGLLRLGHDSSMYVGTRTREDSSVIQYSRSRNPVSRGKRFVRGHRVALAYYRYRFTRPEGGEIFTDDRCALGAGPVQQLPTCDVLNLHWVAGFVDYRAFLPALPAHLPLVWRFADMSPFTGGCHFDEGCGKFRDGCGACPQLGSNATDDLSRRIWQRKQAAYTRLGGRRLQIVTLCRWMADQVKESPLLGKCPIAIIPNGIDLTEFSPRDRCMARDLLGLPRDAAVVLFIADNATNRRKGFSLLSRALSGVDPSLNVLLVSVGSGRPAIEGAVKHVHLGPIEYRFLSLAYSAADLVVVPSLQDNLPNTVLESMACGTPVVGFSVGGIPDMIRHESTGLLVAPGNVPALQTAIRELLLNRPRLEDMGINCRRVTVEEYSLDLQARRYSKLYESLISTQRNETASI